MAQLLFEKIIDLTPEASPVDILQLSNEPSGEVWQYYKTGRLAHDKSAQVTLANYDALEWSKESSSITTKFIKDFRVKAFPGVGSIGFYTPLVGNSRILAPIHIEGYARYKAPTLSMVDNNDGTLTFSITAPSDTTYACYRVILQRTYDAFEYITYETTLVVDKPTVKGEYSCYCIGYVDEGSHISEESNYISLVVTEGSDIPEPAGPQYYTKAEVDYLIENIPGGDIEEMPYEDLVAIWNETIGGTADG